MPRFRLAALSLSILSILILSSFCFAQQAPVLVTQTVDNSVRTVLKGNVHPLTRVAFDQGEVPASMPLHRMLLVLKRSDQQEAALRSLIDESTGHAFCQPSPVAGPGRIRRALWPGSARRGCRRQLAQVQRVRSYAR